MNIIKLDYNNLGECIQLIKSWNIVSLDTETSGNFKDPYDTVIETVQIGHKDTVIFIDCSSFDPRNFIKLLENKIVIGHNIKYDWKLIYLKYGVILDELRDTMLAHQLLVLGFPVSSSLESVVHRYIDQYAYTDKHITPYGVITKEIRQNFKKSGTLSDQEIYYACIDAYYTFRLYDILLSELHDLDLLRAFDLENTVLKPLALMELSGLPINQEMWVDLAEKNQIEHEKLKEELLKVANINWNSDQQVKKVFKSLGINVLFRDEKTGKYRESVSAKYLNKSENELVKLFLKYSGFEKLTSSYGLKFLSNVNSTTGRVHTNFFQLLDTGRTASSDINLQNIPSDKEFRQCFEVGDEDSFVIADYNNQEVVIIADRTEDENLMEAFRRREDVHLWVAKLAFKNDSLKKDSKERKLAKSMNFLLAYGGGATKLAAQFNLSNRVAKEMLEVYYSTFTKLRPTFKSWHNECLSKGYIEIDPITKRKFFYPEYDRYRESLEHAEHLSEREIDYLSNLAESMRRKAQNYKIQGMAASMTKAALCLLYQEWRKDMTLFEFILMVHDEVVLKCKKANSEKVTLLLKKCMEDASKIFLSHLTVLSDPVCSKNWIKD